MGRIFFWFAAPGRKDSRQNTNRKLSKWQIFVLCLVLSPFLSRLLTFVVSLKYSTPDRMIEVKHTSYDAYTLFTYTWSTYDVRRRRQWFQSRKGLKGTKKIPGHQQVPRSSPRPDTPYLPSSGSPILRNARIFQGQCVLPSLASKLGRQVQP